ncbi:MAG: LLM class F420-dependent oxidoreductase [Chloroflexi bacterium]|nr:LLM class F420-dependent oxidoreductase [Chloroflexota bacterium]
MPRTWTFGCTLPASSVALDPGALVGLAQAAEELGYASVWLPDHVVIPERITSAYPYSPDGRFPTPALQPYLEPLASLGYVAGATRRIRFGTHVLILPYRHPLLTAKMVATLDNLSGGRFDFGVGVGWMREEFEALGLDERIYARRGAASDEQLRILKMVWTEDIAEFEGEFYRFDRLGAQPHPIQRPHPPIWVGGHSKPALRRAARFGDGWLPIGGRPPADLPPETLAARWAVIRAEAERAGRDPERLRLCFSTTVSFDPPADPRRPFTGSPEAIAADFDRYHQVGVDSFLVGFGSRPAADYEQHLRRFAEEIEPALAAHVRG